MAPPRTKAKAPKDPSQEPAAEPARPVETAPSVEPAETAVGPEKAAAELLRRQRARESLVEYARSIDVPGAPANADPDNEVFKPVETTMALHHRVILEAIQKTIETPNGRLMIFAPPGSAKSSYASVVTPAWCLAKFPSYRIILASYASKIAEKHSRRTRALCRDPRHVSVWPDRPILASDQRAVGEWALSNGSEFMAAGLLAGITGNRADGVIIDDPVAGREEADSETVQDKTRDEYRDSVISRLKPRAWVVLIQTRWNENDLAGSILPEDYDGRSGMVPCRDGQTWMVLNIPAEAERPDDPLGRKPGEFLWPEWFPLSHWTIRKNDPTGQRTWSSLYQQRPTAAEGIEFKREWARWYNPDLPPGALGGRPLHLRMYGASDFAAKPDRSADFTEHGVAGMDPTGAMYLVDWWHGQTTSDVYIAHWLQMVARHRPTRWWDEGIVIGNAIAPARTRAMREARTYVVCEQLTSIKSKALKLASFQARMAAGLVYFPINRPWAARLLDQLCAFPAGRYDDGADVCGLLGRGIDQMMNASVPSAPTRAQLIPFTGAWLEYEDEPERKVRFS